MKYSIRQLSAEEAEQACRNITTSLPEYFGIEKANERYAKGVKKHTAFGALLNGSCIGMIVCEIPFPNNANIYWMAVKREHQGREIGRSLLKHAENYCFARGCTSMSVETLSPHENNSSYIKTYNFYKKNEFQPLFELNTYGPDFKMVYLCKSLDSW